MENAKIEETPEPERREESPIDMEIELEGED